MKKYLQNMFYEKIISKRYLAKCRYVCNIVAVKLILFFTKKEKKIWLIGTGFDGFENNAKALYLYLKPILGNDLVWVCNKKNYNKLLEEGVSPLVSRGSIRNYILATNAKVGIYSYSDSDIAPRWFRWNHCHTYLVNITHGYTGLKKLEEDYYGSMPVDLICSPSAFDRECNIKYCRADRSKIKITGLPRYDYFFTQPVKTKTKRVLLMPTWRDWYYDGTKDFRKTEMYLQYSRLVELIKRRCGNYELTFILHPSFCNYYTNLKAPLWEDVKLVTTMENIQEQLVKNDILITDYSSVSWDFIYMKKPVIYFWFDYEEYNKKRGLYKEFIEEMQKYICYEAISVVKLLIEIADKNQHFLGWNRKFFSYNDHENCERVYHEIIKGLNQERF